MKDELDKIQKEIKEIMDLIGNIEIYSKDKKIKINYSKKLYDAYDKLYKIKKHLEYIIYMERINNTNEK